MPGGNDYYSIDFGFDPTPEDILSPDERPAVAIIRTSDRISFKSCRRRWAWGSSLRGNLTQKATVDPLWYGTGIHYALEDFHGHNFYGHPTKSFKAYAEACYRLRSTIPLPPMYHELLELGEGMMNYYADQWLSERPQLHTLWIDNQPQVEVRALIEVPFNPREIYPDSPFTKVYYSVTIDRVIEDEDDGGLYLLDYKTAKQMQTQHFAIDPQISAYYWAAGHIYPGRRIKGFIYQQHRKDVPQPPRFLANGTLSTDTRQLTTHAAYRRAIVNVYGASSDRWPRQNLDTLNALAAEETQSYDRYIRRDYVERNDHVLESEGVKILLELEDMLNPHLPLYPNPGRSCAFYCNFYHACVSLDDGSDWQYELELLTKTKSPQSEQDKWRKLLVLPQQQDPLVHQLSLPPHQPHQHHSQESNLVPSS